LGPKNGDGSYATGPDRLKTREKWWLPAKIGKNSRNFAEFRVAFFAEQT
jgi:hypothetical protein